MLVRIGDPAIMLFLEGILRGFGVRISATPEILDELLALFIVSELKECIAFFLGDDVGGVFIEPLTIGTAEFLGGIFGSLLLLLCGWRVCSVVFCGGSVLSICAASPGAAELKRTQHGLAS